MVKMGFVVLCVTVQQMLTCSCGRDCDDSFIHLFISLLLHLAGKLDNSDMLCFI